MNSEVTPISPRSMARELIIQGWDGKNQTVFQFKPNFADFTNPILEGFNISFYLKDFPAIQAIVHQSLNMGNPTVEPVVTTSSSSTTSTSTHIPFSREKGYQRTFELLRSHLYGLVNPFLVLHVCSKLEDFLADPIDVSSKESILLKVTDSSFSYETNELFREFIPELISKASSDLDRLNDTIKDIKIELKEFTLKLKEHSQLLSKDYTDWPDFERLLKIPCFMALKNAEVRKIKALVEQENPDQLREYIDVLDQTKAINIEQANIYLKSIQYKYPVSTLLGEIIEKKPRKKEGVIAYWNRTVEFFNNKTIYINDPNNSHSGTITKAKKKNNVLHFYLHDGSEISVKSNYHVTLTKCYTYKLWTALFFSGNLLNKDVFQLKHSTDTDNKTAIPEGKYQLVNPIKVKAGAISFNNDHFQFELHNIQKKEERYLVIGEYVNGEIYKVSIQRWNSKEQKYSRNLTIQGISTFERSHFAIKKVPENLDGINKENADDRVLIKDEPNEDKLKLMKLEHIKQCLNQIRAEFLKDKNQDLIEILLEDLSKNQLSQVDLNLVANKDQQLANSIRELSQKYFDDLRIDRSSKDILKQVVLEANYIRFVDKKDNIVIARTMELLKDAYVHINNIKDKNLVLVMGNTGSGKSTSISFLMSAPLEEFSNQVGEKVVRVAKGQEDFPKIGQSIGTSETIYTQGFKIPNIDCILGDCPGFNDTRGGDYELCTNLSIDQAVKKAENIRSIVIVIPVNAFLVDRANIVMDLINVVQQRFPKTLDATRPDDNASVFLLVTKQNQAQSEVVRKLKDGTRFLELVRESQKQIDDLINGGSEPDSFEVTSLRKRQNAWKALITMFEKKQIDFIDTKNEAQRDKLIEKYTDSNLHLDKRHYLPAMAGEYMQRKFGDTVQMSTHTWTHHIFGQYLVDLPKSVNILTKELQRKNDQLKESNEKKEQRLEQAKELAKDIIKLEEFIQLLKDNEKSVQDVELRKELLSKASQFSNQKLEKEKIDLQITESKIVIKNSSLQDLEDEIQQFRTSIADTQVTINELKLFIAPLKINDKVTELYSSERTPNSNLRLITWRSEEARRNACGRVEIQDGDMDQTVVYDGRAVDYRGETAEIAIIERSYKLVPTDPSQRQAFFNSFIGGGYIARVEGVRYRLDLGCSALPDGKKIAYGYKLDWNGSEPLPFIKITHTIPNHEYYYATIVDKESEISLLERNLLSLNLELNGGDSFRGALNRKTDLEIEIQNLEIQKAQHLSEIKNIEDESAREQTMDLMIQTTKDLKQARKKEAELKDSTKIDQAILKIQHEIVEDQKSIAALNRKLKYLAIIIFTQWESAKLLRQFADLVVDGHTDNLKGTDQTVISCQKFMNLFDENEKTLLSQIKFEYNF